MAKDRVTSAKGRCQDVSSRRTRLRTEDASRSTGARGVLAKCGCGSLNRPPKLVHAAHQNQPTSRWPAVAIISFLVWRATGGTSLSTPLDTAGDVEAQEERDDEQAQGRDHTVEDGPGPRARHDLLRLSGSAFHGVRD